MSDAGKHLSELWLFSLALILSFSSILKLKFNILRLKLSLWVEKKSQNAKKVFSSGSDRLLYTENGARFKRSKKNQNIKDCLRMICCWLSSEKFQLSLQPPAEELKDFNFTVSEGVFVFGRDSDGVSMLTASSSPIGLDDG